MDILRSILEEVKTGRTRFEPASAKDSDMWDFQPIAKVLIFAHNEGLLESCAPHKESRTANDWYDLALVRGGLTYKGEMFLAKPKDDTAKKIEAIIQLKPTIYGVGIDLMAIWKRWKERKK